MFSSALEVAKFEGSSIRTVSGIRGEIKKALTGDKKAGLVWASFSIRTVVDFGYHPHHGTALKKICEIYFSPLNGTDEYGETNTLSR